MKIQFLSFPGCPNAPAARATLGEALADLGIGETVEEIDVSDPSCDPALRNWGSPTILVDGRDVEHQQTSAALSCRLYSGGTDLAGVPSLVSIRTALERAAHGNEPRNSLGKRR